MKKNTIKKINVDTVIREQIDFQQRVALTTCLLLFLKDKGKSQFCNLFSSEVKKKFKLTNRVFTNQEYIWEFCDSIATYVNNTSITGFGDKYLTFNKNLTALNSLKVPTFRFDKKICKRRGTFYGACIEMFPHHYDLSLPRE